MDGQTESRACVTVGLPDGLHLRPLTILARAAGAFTADVTLRRGEQVADAKRPLELMTLVAECGEELWIEARGEDAEAAVGRISALFSKNFAEDAE